MDVAIPEKKPGDKLPLTDKVYRFVEKTRRDKKNKFIPSVSCFTLSPTDIAEGYGLSVEWDKKTMPEETLARVGSSFKFNSDSEYKDFDTKDIYALSIEFIENTVKAPVLYDPKIYAEKIKGKPNNPAHSIIKFTEEDYNQNQAQIILELRDHAKENKIIVDMDKVTTLVKMQRQEDLQEQ